MIKNERNYITMNERVNIEFYTANDVAVILGVSRATAYRIIDNLNRQLEKMKKITLRGKISKKYFNERLYI